MNLTLYKNMKIDRKSVVRAKFFGTLLFVFLIPLYFWVAIFPETFMYIVGVFTPLTPLAFWCFLSGRYEFRLLISSRYAWIVSTFCVTIGVLNVGVDNLDCSISWYISSFIFFMFTTLFRNLLVVFGLYIPESGSSLK